VLELGCASGGNLIPMAYGLPESEFVGIDYAARQIAEGQAAVAALGLDNGAPVEDAEEIKATLAEALEWNLHGLARAALLVG
jgi:tRNA G46 methylase TrmB